MCRLPGGAAALGRMAWEKDVAWGRRLLPLPPPGATVKTQKRPVKATGSLVLQGGCSGGAVLGAGGAC